MPQMDRRRLRSVPIEFEPNETLATLPQPGRVSLVLATDGKAGVILNGKAVTIAAPCAICLSFEDSLQVIENCRLFAQSFSLSPDFLKTRLTFRQIKGGAAVKAEAEHARDALMLFFSRNENYHGVLHLPPQFYMKIFEWLCIIGAEINAQSDGCWTCRVRRYFLQILNLLDELYESGEGEGGIEKADSPADAAMEYIHTHYMEEVTLETLCNLTHVNRTTLNKLYKQRTGQSLIDYLLSYRLRVATELLAHTGLTIDEIARSTGFGYDTYLIRRFTAKMGKTPTEYRQAAREKYGIIVQKM